MMAKPKAVIVPVPGGSDPGSGVMKTQCARMFICLSVLLLMAGPAMAQSVETSAPESQAAHELTHTAQQGAGQPVDSKKAAEETSQQRQQCDAACRENYQNNAPGLQACLRSCGAIGPAEPAAIAVTPDATAPAMEATTVKSSKSNSQDRTSTVKGSKSNTSERHAAPVTPPPTPVETSNLNLSKSNIDRTAGETPGTPVEGATSETDAAKVSTYTSEEGDTVSTVDDQR